MPIGGLWQRGPHGRLVLKPLRWRHQLCDGAIRLCLDLAEAWGRASVPAPMTEWELWACANEVLRQHGDDAAFVAAQRADQLLGESDHDGALTWRAILRRINELQARTAGLPH